MKDCPRAKWWPRKASKKAFLVQDDPAAMEVAKMVVAGVDKKHSLHPMYSEWCEEYGEINAKSLIEEIVDWNHRGACDCVQTKMDLGGSGLFGGRSEDGKRFIFYEWISPPDQLFLSLTVKRAREMVSGQRGAVVFHKATRRHHARRKRAKEELFRSVGRI